MDDKKIAIYQIINRLQNYIVNIEKNFGKSEIANSELDQPINSKKGGSDDSKEKIMIFYT